MAERRWAMRVSKSFACDDEDEEGDFEGGYVDQQALKVSCRPFFFFFFIVLLWLGLGVGVRVGVDGMNAEANGFVFVIDFLCLSEIFHTLNADNLC